MSPAALAVLRRTPLFHGQATIKRCVHLTECFGHSQSGRVQRATLIVVEDATDDGTVVQYHATSNVGRISLACGVQGPCLDHLRSRIAPPVQNGPFDSPQTTNLLSHLNLRMAVCLQNGLGQIPQEVVRTVPVGHARELSLDPSNKSVLFIRDPQRYPMFGVSKPSPKTLSRDFALFSSVCSIFGRRFPELRSDNIAKFPFGFVAFSP